jgi:hypothetical protein
MKLIKLFGCFTTWVLLSFIYKYPLAQEVKNAAAEIKKISLFKNGQCFVVYKTTLPDDAVTIKIGQLPVPSFGTFWVGYPEKTRVKSIISSIEEIEKKIPVQSIQQLLRLNPGKKVVLHTADKDIEGIILRNNSETTEESLPNPYYMSTHVPKNSYKDYTPQVIFNDLLSVQTEKGIVLLNASSVLRAEFNEDDLIDYQTVKEKLPAMRIEVEEPYGGEKLSISCVARGITWLPGYLIDLSDPETAKFSAHAVIVNELTELKNTEAQLVTGFPNIKYSDVVSPVAKSQSLADFIASLRRASIQTQSPGVLTQQVLLSNALMDAEYPDGSLLPGYSAAAEGSTEEDFFFYPVKNFSLKCNETAWIPLFSADMPYKHIYTWKIKDYMDKEERYYTQISSQQEEETEEVWHSCRITNTLSMPLTTASTEFITNGEFVGQDICYYTPAKSQATIRINKALNVLAEQSEIEIERKREALYFRGYAYDLVKIKGELKIRNKLARNINLEITKDLTGEFLNSNHKYEDTKTAKGLKRINEKHVLNWETDLGAGEEKNITYQYQVYIRN